MRQGSLFSTIESSSTWRPSAPPVLDGIDEIALDAETTGLRWWRHDRPIGFGIAYKRDGKLISQYLPFAHKGGGNLDEAVVKRWMQREVRGKKIKNLNAPFDNNMAYKWGVDLEEQGCVWGDIAHYMGLLNDQRKSGFSLEAISQENLKQGKIKGLDASRMAEYHAGDVREYAEQDVRLIILNMDVIRPKLINKKLMRVADLEDQCIFPVCEMMRNGAPINTEKLHAWIKKADQQIAEALWKLYKLVGVKVDPTNRDDMVRLFRIRGIEIKRWTSGGATREPQPSFTDEVLAGIKDEAIALVRFCRKLESMKSKYLIKYRDDLRGGNILRYALHQLRGDEGGTISGRFSSSSLTDSDDDEDSEGINVQQVMRIDKNIEVFGEDYIVRELYEPELYESGPRWLWLSADAKQIEFRLFAHYSKSERLKEAYIKDPETDFHNIVWDILKKFDPEISRKLTKDTNFAEIYGAGLPRTAHMLKISMERAKEFVGIYNSMFPEAKQLINHVSGRAEKRGYVMTVMGRRFYFPDGQFLHKALSRVIQGTAADIMKTKLVELHKARKQTGFKMRFTVHDEVDGDVPDMEAAEKVRKILNSQSFNLRVPILWDVSVGANWREAA